ncbi:5970_t:CDS:10 [Acaulospora morrowiae]|uniref:5970_t:CDS:1 n=1 Tax=Acaulospora morrowiae TaxID=94023 RepID=A0A9N9FDN8_9GLOM|nr:5970_t:CDS:10 [Acaulospora morrowiae]
MSVNRETNSDSSSEKGGVFDTNTDKKIDIGFKKTLILAFQSIGVIYGDIGTSPLYVYTGIFSDPPGDSRDVVGVLSLIIWSLTIVTLIKYVFFILRADDNGEGGTFALYSLLSRHSGISIRGELRVDDLTTTDYDAISTHSRNEKPNFIKRSKIVQRVLLVVVLFGTSLVMSDGLLTPAISVISAVEGIAVPAPHLIDAVVPISCAIIVFLFLGQSFGTGRVGGFFAPLIFLWFLSLAIIGVWNITKYPAVLKALNPYHAINYFSRNGGPSFEVLGGVLLAITGVEALYADLGHFNRTSIQISFPFLVYPSLLLAYMGQGARLILDPNVITNTFWKTLPASDGPIYWIIFVLATVATIIASQAMISATFSLIHQAMQLDCFPRVKIVHTSKSVAGQIYIPEVDIVVLLFSQGAMVVTLIFLSPLDQLSSNDLHRDHCDHIQAQAWLWLMASVAVSSVMFISTILYTLVLVLVFRLPIFVAVSFFLVFGLIDVSFLSATLLKVSSGGWFTLTIGVLLCLLMLLWQWGTTRTIEFELDRETRLDKLFDNIASDELTLIEDQDDENIVNSGGRLQLFKTSFVVNRLPGISLFYKEVGVGVPLTFSHFVQHFPAIAETLIFITIFPVPVPIVSEESKLVVRKIRNYEGIYQVIARYGYMEDVSQGDKFIEKLVNALCKVDPTSTCLSKGIKDTTVTYVLSQYSIISRPNSAWWKRALVNGYIFLMNNSRRIHDSWHIPVEDVVDIGIKVPI